MTNPHDSFNVGLYHTLARPRQQQQPKGNTVASSFPPCMVAQQQKHVYWTWQEESARLGGLKDSVWW